jgi:hypothetical protein
MAFRSCRVLLTQKNSRPKIAAALGQKVRKEKQQRPRCCHGQRTIAALPEAGHSNIGRSLLLRCGLQNSFGKYCSDPNHVRPRVWIAEVTVASPASRLHAADNYKNAPASDSQMPAEMPAQMAVETTAEMPADSLSPRRTRHALAPLRCSAATKPAL